MTLTQKKIGTPTDSTTELYRYAVELFKEGWRREPIRQLGVRADKLTESRVCQLSLLGQDETDKQKTIDRAVDAMRERLGDESVMRASFLCRDTKENHSLDRFIPFRSTGRL